MIDYSKYKVYADFDEMLSEAYNTESFCDYLLKRIPKKCFDNIIFIQTPSRFDILTVMKNSEKGEIVNIQ